MIGNIIGIAILCFLVFGIGVFIIADINADYKWLIIPLTIVALIIAGDIWYLKGTETGKRLVKDTQSNFSGGIEREVRVYDINGDILEKYEGKFDIEYYDTHIKFDDENGKRHLIYFRTGTIIVDEK